MRGGLSHSWQAPLSLCLSLPQFHSVCISITFYLIHSQFCWHLLALFVCDSLSVFCSLSALVPLCLTSLRCHQSLTACLSVILCLIAIDCYRSHMRTKLIKADKHRYFYHHIWNTPTHANASAPKTYTPFHTLILKVILNTYLVFIDRFLTFGWKSLVLIVPLFNWHFVSVCAMGGCQWMSSHTHTQKHTHVYLPLWRPSIHRIPCPLLSFHSTFNQH